MIVTTRTRLQGTPAYPPSSVLPAKIFPDRSRRMLVKGVQEEHARLRPVVVVVVGLVLPYLSLKTKQRQQQKPSNKTINS